MPFTPRYLVQYESQAHITIDVTDRILKLDLTGHSSSTFPCAVGKPSTPSPIGSWRIVIKTINPSWEVLGTRWMGLNVPWGNYGIHGTNAPWSIGNQISNGCIRMYNSDVEYVYDHAPIGTPVDIVGSYGQSAAGLRLGSAGPAVQELQGRLIVLGYLAGPADGVFGPETELALRRFQYRMGLPADGVAGPATLRALGIA